MRQKWLMLILAIDPLRCAFRNLHTKNINTYTHEKHIEIVEKMVENRRHTQNDKRNTTSTLLNTKQRHSM